MDRTNTIHAFLQLGFISACLWAAGATTCVRGLEPPRRFDHEEATICIAIHDEDWGLASDGSHDLKLAVWDDGYAVWRADGDDGGFMSARIDKDRLRKTLEGFDKSGLFQIDESELQHWGPDSKFTNITIRHSEKVLRLQSWHEIAEKGDTTVGSRTGLASLGNRRRLEFLREEPADYLFFRMTWLEVKSRCLELIPKGGGEVEGELSGWAGKFYWQETSARE